MTAIASVAATRLASRTVLVAAGPDVVTFLNGVCTANTLRTAAAVWDVRRETTNPVVGFGQLAAVLTPRGRMVADVFLMPAPRRKNTILVDCDVNDAPRLASYFSRFLLRSNVRISRADPSSLAVFAAWSPSSTAITKESEVESSFPTANTSYNDFLLRDTMFRQQQQQQQKSDDTNDLSAVMVDHRAPHMGIRVISSPSQFTEALASSTTQIPATNAKEDAFHLMRMLNGVPEGHSELSKYETMPMEANFDLMKGIDFDKGCYLGQELIIRTKHTGVVRNRIMPVKIVSNKPDTTTIPNVIGASINLQGKSTRSKVLAQANDIGLARITLSKRLEPHSIEGFPDVSLVPIIPKWWPQEVLI